MYNVVSQFKLPGCYSNTYNTWSKDYLDDECDIFALVTRIYLAYLPYCWSLKLFIILAYYD